MFSQNKKNKSGMSLPVIIIGITIASAIIASTTSWLLSLNAKVSNIDGQLEAMTVATSEWNRLNNMSMEDLEAQKDSLSDYTVGDYQIMVVFGDKGKMADGKCQTTEIAEDDEKNCYNDSKVVIKKDGETLYSSKLLPLTAGGSGGSGKVPELDWAKRYYVGATGHGVGSVYSHYVSVSGTTSYTLPHDAYVQFAMGKNTHSIYYVSSSEHSQISGTYNVNGLSYNLGNEYYAKGTVLNFGFSHSPTTMAYDSVGVSTTSGAYIIPVK